MKLSPEEKRAQLETGRGGQEADAKVQRGREKTLEEWGERSRALKYVNSGDAAAYAAFQQAGPKGRAVILEAKEKAFYAKHDPELAAEREGARVFQAQRVRGSEELSFERPRGRQPNSPLEHAQVELMERKAQSHDREEMDGIKRGLRGQALLAEVSRSHSVDVSRYTVRDGTDGRGDRIQCGREGSAAAEAAACDGAGASERAGDQLGLAAHH